MFDEISVDILHNVGNLLDNVNLTDALLKRTFAS